MARRKPAPAKEVLPSSPEPAISEALAGQPARPSVFVSHDARDAALAEAFSNLLTDASAGVLKSFRSSDKKGTAGIDYGSEWYKAIMDALGRATDVVALLTQHSIGRPWILFEAGVAKGKLDAVVFGVALGIPLEKAISGPFSQFQNCGDSEDELTKLVMQLIRRVPNADPREEAIRRQVRAFRENVGELLKRPAKSPGGTDDTSVAKLFEEVKLLFRDLPQLVESKLREMRPGGWPRIRRLHPMVLEEILHSPLVRERQGGDALGWLLFLSFLRDGAPWLYEMGMDVYRALRSGDRDEVDRTSRQFREALRLLRHGHPLIMELSGPLGEEGPLMHPAVAMFADQFLGRLVDRPPRTRRRTTTRGTRPDLGREK